MKSKANATSFKPGNKGGGRPAKTDEERAGYAFLSERTVGAAQRLVQLEASDDEKIALAATVAHLKIVIGDLQREAGKDGEPLTPHSALTLEELKAVGRAQLQRESESLQTAQAAK